MTTRAPTTCRTSAGAPTRSCDWVLKGIGMDGRAYDGVVLFSLGPNLEFGGTNDTKCHMDLPDAALHRLS